MPSAKKKEIQAILGICKNTDADLKILPGVYQLVNGDVSVQKLRNVEIEDLLGQRTDRYQDRDHRKICV